MAALGTDQELLWPGPLNPGSGGGVDEIVETGSTLVAGLASAAYTEARVLTVGDTYDPTVYYPFVTVSGQIWDTTGGGLVAYLTKFWQDFSSSQIKTQMYFPASSNGLNFKIRWEIRKKPVGSQLYQAVHTVAVTANTTDMEKTITLNSSIRSATKCRIESPFRGHQLADTGLVSYFAQGNGLDKNSTAAIYWHALHATGLAGVNYDIPVVIIH